MSDIEIGDRPPERVPLTGGWPGAVVTGLVVAVALGLAALVLFGRALAAPPVPVALGTALLPYLFLVLGCVAFFVWVLLPDRWLLPTVVVGLLVVGVASWGPGWVPSPDVASGIPLRVMSWNVRRLWGAEGDGGDAVACTVAAIREAHPDVLTLLEVSSDDVARLSEALDLRCVHHTYHQEGGAERGGLAACAAGERWELRAGEGLRFVDDEDWYYVFTEIVSGDRVLNLLAVHLYPYGFDLARRISGVVPRGEEGLLELGAKVSKVARGQSDQSAALLDRIGRLNDPTLLAGDFNSTRDAALHASLREHLTDTWEQAGFGFGGTIHLFERLPLRVDHVYASPDFAVRDATVPGVDCSDHRPVVTDLVLRDAP